MTLLFSKESDYFWHVKAGEVMFNNGKVLCEDVFSWFREGEYWMSHEWGFDYLIYAMKHLFGDVHLFLYSFVCTLGLLFILFFSNKKSYIKNIIFSLFWLICFLIFCVYIQARPHLISFLFVALTIWFCYDLFKNEYSKKIYSLPLITVFWANFHGGSSNLSYLFCFVFLIVGLFKFKFSKLEAMRINKNQALKYLGVSVLCMLAICINPHGIRMLIYPYFNITDTIMISFISEWQPTVLSSSNHYPYFLLIIVIMFILLLSKEKIKLIDFILFGISVFLGLKSVRFWAYTYIIMSYVVFNYIPSRKIDRGTTRILFMLGSVFLAIFISNYDMLAKEYRTTYISAEMIDTIKSENPQRLYNMYDYGGELIYNDIKVFVDGRADLYSRYNLKDYADISKLANGSIGLMDKYDFDYFLVDRNYPINIYLEYNSDKYELLKIDENTLFYKKKDSI